MSDRMGDTLIIEQGRVFREAWIAGVIRHYPGEPKASYIAPWDETPEWERESAAAVYEQVRAFIEATNHGTAKLTRTQKGTLCSALLDRADLQAFSRSEASLRGGLGRLAAVAAGN